MNHAYMTHPNVTNMTCIYVIGLYVTYMTHAYVTRLYVTNMTYSYVIMGWLRLAGSLKL